MKENFIYFGRNEFYELVKELGGKWEDTKERPLVCLIKSTENENLYWAIPMGNLLHRSAEARNRIQHYIDFPDNDIRSCYYHIGRTTVPSIFFVSDVVPITDKYIEREYTGYDNNAFEIKNINIITALNEKLKRILAFENNKNNHFRQHITDIKEYLLKELQELKSQSAAVEEIISIGEVAATIEKQ